MERPDTSTFPMFNDGDVMLVISPEHIYRLHSSVLRRCSGFFASVLTESRAAKLSSKATRAGNRVRFYLQLIFSPANANGVFQMKELDKFGRAPKAKMNFGDIAEGQIPDMTSKHWNNLLGAFYNRTVDINDVNMENVLRSCMGLLETAESIQASDIIRQSIDIALLRQGQVLWRSIASKPVQWANLGDRIHSPTIFRDAVIHVVGKWNSLTKEQRSVLYPNVRKICEKKHEELQLKMKAVELRILGHYPAFLHRSPKENIYRATYANDVYMWMAVAFYRQWFSQQVSDGRNRTAEDGGATFYRALGAGGRAYLTTRDQASFHLYFPMSSKAMRIIENNLNVLKTDVKKFVADLLVDNSQVDTVEHGQLPHLTCCVVKKADMLWTMPASPKPSLADEDLTDDDADHEMEEDPDSLFVGAKPGSEGYAQEDKAESSEQAADYPAAADTEVMEEVEEDIDELTDSDNSKAFI